MNQPLSRTRAQVSADFLELDQLYATLYNRCSSVQALWRPENGSWSVAECIQHVALSISQYLTPMRRAIAKGGPPAPDAECLFVPRGWFSNAFLKRIGPQVTLKMKAPGKIRPLAVEPEQAFQNLRNGHAEIQQLLQETSRLDLNRVRFRNPFIPVLRFTVATGFLVLAAHGRRHLLQAERVTGTKGFPEGQAQQSA